MTREKTEEARKGCSGRGQAEWRKGHSMVCVITCFASIGSVCTVRQSTSVSPATGADGGGRNWAGHWLCFCWGEEEGDKGSKRHSPYSSAESKTVLSVGIILNRARTASTRRTSLDMEDMKRDINQYKDLLFFFQLTPTGLTLYPPRCCPRLFIIQSPLAFCH